MTNVDAEPSSVGHIFLSYSRQDSAVVARIRAALERAGHTVWQDTYSVAGGEVWVHSIENGIKDAAAVVVVLTDASANSTWVQVETLLALRLEKKIVPFALAPDFIPFALLHINPVDASTDLDQGMDRLLSSLPSSAVESVNDSYKLLPDVIRLASDMVDRRGLGIRFVVMLGGEVTSPELPSAVAALAADRWTNLIIAFSDDPRLDQALERAGLVDAKVSRITAGHLSVLEFLTAVEQPSMAVRVVSLHHHSALRESGTGRDWLRWQRALAMVLRHDTLIVGHTSADPDLAKLIPAKGDAVWRIGTEPDPSPEVLAILAARRSMDRVITTLDGGGRFLTELVKVLVTGKDTRQLPGPPHEEHEELDRDRLAALDRLQGDLAQLLRQLHFDASGTESARQPSTRESDLMHRIRLEMDALSQAGEGTILGGFQILSKLGRGGIGSVYLATHLYTGLPAAVKIMSRESATDPVARARFFRGARIMAVLQHRHIVRVLDVGGRVGPWNYYVIEYVAGTNLELLLAADALEEPDRWRIGRELLSAIAVAHEYPDGAIVHRDIKPSNVLVDQRGEVKVTDFDAAFLEDVGQLTQLSLTSVGTSFYSPPELASTPVLAEFRDPRVDVFAIGRVLLRVFTSIAAVEHLALRYSANVDLLRVALSRRVPGPAASALGQVLHRATASDPLERYEDAGELLRALTQVEQLALRAAGEFSASELSFITVKPGRFTMGSPTDEAGRHDSEVPHEVVVTNGLSVSATPVTRQAWATVFGLEPPDIQSSRLPVERVSWYEALSFCNALSLFTGLTPCYTMTEDGIEWDRDAPGFRLPTEAEWEFLCRASTRTAYHSGDGEEDLAAAGWYEGNCPSGPRLVGGLRPNAWGLLDMHGNVWEWCWDWFGPYSPEEQVDPSGPATGESRMLRGGSWRRSRHHCRSATRYDSSPENHGKSLGLRVVRTLAAT